MLFLDELPEFSRAACEALRQPLEEGEVTVSRAMTRVRFPARFALVAAANPCPCGHLGDPERECTCAPQRLNAYRSRLSGPLLDRFDLRVQAPRAESHGAAGEASAVVAARVAEAAERMAGGKLELSPDAARLMDDAVRRQLLAGRGATRTAAVAQSISALAAAGRVESDHLAEALSYRQPL